MSIRAKEEFRDILDFYINRNNSPSYSLKLLSETEEITKLLETNHFLGRNTDNKITRVIVKDAFLIFMRLAKTTLKSFPIGIIDRILTEE